MLWVIYSIITAIFYGLSLALRKKGLVYENIIDFIGAFSIIGFVFSIPILFFPIQYEIPNISLLLIFLACAASVVVTFFLTAAMKNEEVSTVIPLLNLSPVILLIFSFLLLSEKPSGMEILGVFVIIVGGYFLTTKDLKSWKHPFTEIKKKDLFYMGLTLFLLSLSAIIHKAVLMRISSYSLFFWGNIFYMAIVSIVVIAAKRIKQVIALLKKHFWILFIPAFLGNITDFLIYYILAMPGVLVSVMIPILRFATLVSIFVGGQVLHEKNMTHKIVASLIMIGGICIIAFF
jgi:drug/metabolite transporter (DMT)-like permease